MSIPVVVVDGNCSVLDKFVLPLGSTKAYDTFSECLYQECLKRGLITESKPISCLRIYHNGSIILKVPDNIQGQFQVVLTLDSFSVSFSPNFNGSSVHIAPSGPPYPQQLQNAIKDAQAAMDFGYSPNLSQDGLGGTYFLASMGPDEHAACFKPFDEEIETPANPRDHAGIDVGLPLLSRIGFSSGCQFSREVAAYVMDASSGYIHGVPPTGIAESWSEIYNNKEHNSMHRVSYDKQLPKDLVPKLGSFQLFMSGMQSIEDFAPSRFSDYEIQKIALLDLRILNVDRNEQNILFKEYYLPKEYTSYYDSLQYIESLKGKPASPPPDTILSLEPVQKGVKCKQEGEMTVFRRLVPIDHGLSFPEKLQLGWTDWVWLTWSQLRKPLHPYLKAKFLETDVEDSIYLLQHFLGPRISQKSLSLVRIIDRLLKKLVIGGLTLSEIGDMVARLDTGMTRPSRAEHYLSLAATEALSMANQHNHGQNYSLNHGHNHNQNQTHQNNNSGLNNQLKQHGFTAAKSTISFNVIPPPPSSSMSSSQGDQKAMTSASPLLGAPVYAGITRSTSLLLPSTPSITSLSSPGSQSDLVNSGSDPHESLSNSISTSSIFSPPPIEQRQDLTSSPLLMPPVPSPASASVSQPPVHPPSLQTSHESSVGSESSFGPASPTNPPLPGLRRELRAMVLAAASIDAGRTAASVRGRARPHLSHRSGAEVAALLGLDPLRFSVSPTSPGLQSNSAYLRAQEELPMISVCLGASSDPVHQLSSLVGSTARQAPSSFSRADSLSSLASMQSSFGPSTAASLAGAASRSSSSLSLAKNFEAAFSASVNLPEVSNEGAEPRLSPIGTAAARALSTVLQPLPPDNSSGVDLNSAGHVSGTPSVAELFKLAPAEVVTTVVVAVALGRQMCLAVLTPFQRGVVLVDDSELLAALRAATSAALSAVYMAQSAAEDGSHAGGSLDAPVSMPNDYSHLLHKVLDSTSFVVNSDSKVDDKVSSSTAFSRSQINVSEKTDGADTVLPEPRAPTRSGFPTAPPLLPSIKTISPLRAAPFQPSMIPQSPPLLRASNLSIVHSGGGDTPSSPATSEGSRPLAISVGTVDSDKESSPVLRKPSSLGVGTPSNTAIPSPYRTTSLRRTESGISFSKESVQGSVVPSVAQQLSFEQSEHDVALAIRARQRELRQRARASSTLAGLALSRNQSFDSVRRPEEGTKSSSVPQSGASDRGFSHSQDSLPPVRVALAVQLLDLTLPVPAELIPSSLQPVLHSKAPLTGPRKRELDEFLLSISLERARTLGTYVGELALNMARRPSRRAVQLEAPQPISRVPTGSLSFKELASMKSFYDKDRLHEDAASESYRYHRDVPDSLSRRFMGSTVAEADEVSEADTPVVALSTPGGAKAISSERAFVLPFVEADESFLSGLAMTLVSGGSEVPLGVPTAGSASFPLSGDSGVHTPTSTTASVAASSTTAGASARYLEALGLEEQEEDVDESEAEEEAEVALAERVKLLGQDLAASKGTSDADPNTSTVLSERSPDAVADGANDISNEANESADSVGLNLSCGLDTSLEGGVSSSSSTSYAFSTSLNANAPTISSLTSVVPALPVFASLPALQVAQALPLTLLTEPTSQSLSSSPIQVNSSNRHSRTEVNTPLQFQSPLPSVDSTTRREWDRLDRFRATMAFEISSAPRVHGSSCKLLHLEMHPSEFRFLPPHLVQLSSSSGLEGFVRSPNDEFLQSTGGGGVAAIPSVPSLPPLPLLGGLSDVPPPADASTSSLGSDKRNLLQRSASFSVLGFSPLSPSFSSSPFHSPLTTGVPSLPPLKSSRQSVSFSPHTSSGGGNGIGIDAFAANSASNVNTDFSGVPSPADAAIPIRNTFSSFPSGSDSPIGSAKLPISAAKGPEGLSRIHTSPSPHVRRPHAVYSVSPQPERSRPLLSLPSSSSSSSSASSAAFSSFPLLSTTVSGLPRQKSRSAASSPVPNAPLLKQSSSPLHSQEYTNPSMSGAFQDRIHELDVVGEDSRLDSAADSRASTEGELEAYSPSEQEPNVGFDIQINSESRRMEGGAGPGATHGVSVSLAGVTALSNGPLSHRVSSSGTGMGISVPFANGISAGSAGTHLPAKIPSARSTLFSVPSHSLSFHSSAVPMGGFKHWDHANPTLLTHSTSNDVQNMDFQFEHDRKDEDMLGALDKWLQLFISTRKQSHKFSSK